MKSTWKLGLGSELAIAALALCFLPIPGKAQDTAKGKPEAPACTSYPEWSCEPQTTPSGRGAVSAKMPEKAAKMAEDPNDPTCTSYPEWSCEPQASSSGGRSKAPVARMTREGKPKRNTSDSAGPLDESFERRPY